MLRLATTRHRSGGFRVARGVNWRSRPGPLCWVAALLAVSAGCGTTKWSDTPRTATEQLLISDAVDRAVSDFDFAVLAGKSVYFDNTYLKGSVDENYVVSSLRQHLLASGCYLMESREAADYVVEARAGAVGTDRSDLLFGVPSVNVPSVPGLPVAVPSSIPEIPLAKTTNQKAVAKLAVFAYNRRTGRPVLQTGVDPAISTARNSWLFGAGPFRRGTIYDHHQVLDSGVDIPIIGGRESARDYADNSIPVTAEAVFPEPAVEPTASPALVADNQSAGATNPAASQSLPPSVAANAPATGSPTSQPSAIAAGAAAPASAANPPMARLPAADNSGLARSPAGPAAGSAAGEVQRAQFIEPSPLSAPSSPLTSQKAVGESGSQPKKSRWNILRPSTWGRESAPK